jgi:DHA2 family multidrug resistance protein
MGTSSVAVPSHPAAAIPRAVNPWIVALAVVIPTFMEVLDTTIANVALRHIAGGLSAAVTDGEWVITSYLAANAIILPISGWLSIHLGRRNYFLLSILVFTIASALCGMATSLNMLIFSRILQGLAGGGLQPSSQGVLLDAFPKEKQGAAQTVFGIAALLAPVVGPTLGGYITDNYGWRWVFYINVPVGLLALVMCHALVFDPPYLKALGAEARKQRRPFDTLGLTLLAVTMTSWEVLLSKGQEWDWFGDPFLRVQTLALLFVLGLGGLIVRETRYDNPLINFRTLKDRNFLVCCVIIFCAFATLYANTVSLPALFQSLFGYDATTSGLVLSPAGIFAIIVLAIMGRFLGRGVDARYLMAAGLFILGVGGYWMSRLNLEISPWQIVWPRVVFIMGLSAILLRLTLQRSCTFHLNFAALRSGCLRFCATKVAASELPLPRQFRSAAINSTLCDLAKISIRSIRQ